MKVTKGNYHHYYNKRSDLEERLDFFQSDWFESKICLDIGCNDGLITTEIAQRFQPEFITGIDVDTFLIESAESRIKRSKYILRKENQTVLPTQTSLVGSIQRFTPRSVKLKTTSLQPTLPNIPNEEKSVATIDSIGTNSSCVNDTNNVVPLPATVSLFPENIAFLKKDIFQFSESNGGRYDTILCLSVTKWIHLNGGDELLLALFDKMYELLKPNGILILEYQPWKSYKKRKDMTAEIEQNFRRIQIFPKDFEQKLIIDYEFELIEKRYSEESATGFKRPILALRKGLSSIHSKSHFSLVEEKMPLIEKGNQSKQGEAGQVF